MFNQTKLNLGRSRSRTLAERTSPEGAHQLMMQLSQYLSEGNVSREVVQRMVKLLWGTPDKSSKIELWGHEYQSAIGLGAGVIKEPDGLGIWDALPFGWIELGGIQGKAQPGNPQPRVWRNDEQDSIQNFYGLPTTGVHAIAARLERLKQEGRLPDNLWANLGNSLTTTTDQDKIDEFGMMTETIFPYVQVIVLNFSCPNQAEGENSAQKSKDLLKGIIRSAQYANERTALKMSIPKRPILVKIGPRQLPTDEAKGGIDLTEEEIRMIVEVCEECGVEGIVSTNTAKNQTGYDGAQPKGGISGAVLHERSAQTIEFIRELGYRGTIVGVGGVGTGKTVDQVRASSTRLLDAGADVQEIVTSFILNPASIIVTNEAVRDYYKNRMAA